MKFSNELKCAIADAVEKWYEAIREYEIDDRDISYRNGMMNGIEIGWKAAYEHYVKEGEI